MTTYAVTGATGNLAPLVIDRLIARGVPAAHIVAVARTPGRAAALTARGVEVRQGDYDQPRTLDTALSGVDRLLLVSSPDVGRRLPQHANVVAAAMRTGVRHIAYTSLLKADSSTLVLAPEHIATEGVLADSGLPHTILRNGWYTENFTAQLAQYVASRTVAHAAGDGRVAAATRADLADAAAVSLLRDATNQVYELAGPSITYADVAATVAEVTGTPVVATALAPDALVRRLTAAGLDEATARILAGFDASIAEGHLDGRPTDLEALLGRPATPLAEPVRAAHRAAQRQA